MNLTVSIISAIPSFEFPRPTSEESSKNTVIAMLQLISPSIRTRKFQKLLVNSVQYFHRGLWSLRDQIRLFSTRRCFGFVINYVRTPSGLSCFIDLELTDFTVQSMMGKKLKRLREILSRWKLKLLEGSFSNAGAVTERRDLAKSVSSNS